MIHSNVTARFLATIAALPMGIAAAQTSTTRVSVGPGGIEANGVSESPRISANGRFVVFVSHATNLVANDTNGIEDIFVHDRTMETTERANVSTAGDQANGFSRSPCISGDGRYVAFETQAGNLVGAGIASGLRVAVRDRVNGTTRLATTGLPTTESSRPTISVDGRFLAFKTPMPNGQGGERVARRDLLTDAVAFVEYALGTPYFGGAISISGSGRYIVGQSGDQGLGLIDFDTMSVTWLFGPLPSGQVAYSPGFDFNDTVGVLTNVSLATTDPGGSDIYTIDRATGSADRITLPTGGGTPNGNSGRPGLNLDGRYVVFDTYSSNLGPTDGNGTGDVYLRDRTFGLTELISQSSSGVIGDQLSDDPSISGDGRYVAFVSEATNLVPGDTNGREDIFVRDRWFPLPSNYCVAKVNSQGCLPSIGYQGTPSRTGADDFFLTATSMRNQSVGLLIWGSGPDIVPFAGGIRCVRAPVIRTPPQQSGGSQLPIRDCTGSYSFHFSHALMQGYFLPPGTVVYAQYWQRDPPHPDGTGQGLSDGLRFTIWP